MAFGPLNPGASDVWMKRMTLPRYLSQAGSNSSELEELLAGLPTIAAFARLCGNVLAQSLGADRPPVDLSSEAQAILCAARQCGILEIKGTQQEFESARRLLAVYVETGPGCYQVFRNPRDPQVTLRFLDGFRELCIAGFVMHQMGAEFSLTRLGFEHATTLDESSLQVYLDMGYLLD